MSTAHPLTHSHPVVKGIGRRKESARVAGKEQISNTTEKQPSPSIQPVVQLSEVQRFLWSRKVTYHGGGDGEDGGSIGTNCLPSSIRPEWHKTPKVSLMNAAVCSFPNVLQTLAFWQNSGSWSFDWLAPIRSGCLWRGWLGVVPIFLGNRWIGIRWKTFLLC